MTSSATILPFWQKLFYSFGQIAGQVFRDVPSVLLLFFLTNVIGISPAVAGTAIFLPKLIVGIFADFIVGLTSQKNPKNWPKWIAAGMVLAPIAMYLLFRVPDAAQNIQIAYIVGIFSFYMAVFGVFSVPYLAIASRLAANSEQSTNLMAWRLGFTAIGVLVASGFAPFFLSINGSFVPETAQAAYNKLGVALALICFLTLLMAYIGTRASAAFKDEAFEKGQDTIPQVKLSAIWTALKKPRFSPLILANLVQLTGAGMSYAAFLYFLNFNMEIADPFSFIPKLIILSSIGIIIAQPLWVKLAKHFGKKKIFAFSSFFQASVMIFWALTSGVSSEVTYGLAFLMGVANSGWAMLGFSMVADISADGDSGIYSAAWISVDKIGFALGGTLLIGLALTAFGFDASAAATGGEQPASAFKGIMLCFGIIPGILYALGGLIFLTWGKEK